MPVKEKKVDRRASRTRQALNTALIALIVEKRYDAITIQDILDLANVGRSTFYAHYRDKEDLLRSTFDEFFAGWGQHLKWENLEAGRVMPVLELFKHLQEAQKFYRALVRARKADELFRNGPGQMAKGVEKSLTSWLGKRKPSVPVPVLANYVASGILSLLKWWLDHDMPHPPQRMDEIFHELMMPGLRVALVGGKATAAK